MADRVKKIIEAFDQAKAPNLFLWSLLVVGKKTHQVEEMEIHTRKSGRETAPFVGPNLSGTFLGRKEFQIKSFKAPHIKPYKVAAANDLFKINFGSHAYATDMNQAVGNAMNEDLKHLDTTITRKELAMLGELMSTGKISIKGKGVSREAIGYGTDAENIETLTGSDMWDQATSDPLGDIERWRDLVLEKTGIAIDSIVMTPTAKRAFLGHEDLKDKLKITQPDLVRINPRNLGDGASFLGTIPELNMDIYSYIDWYEDDAGIKKSVLPEGGVLACRSKTVTQHYGAIAQKKSDDSPRQIFVGSRIPKIWGKGDNDYIRLSAAPLPVVHDADGFVFSTVVSA